MFAKSRIYLIGDLELLALTDIGGIHEKGKLKGQDTTGQW
jgi:hypothetical protein